MAGYVYLIGEMDTPNKFKIGSTKQDDINKRLKQLQTGNDNELYIKHYYKTSHPLKLEQMLHTHYGPKKILNEWFELTEDDINGFIEMCKRKDADLKVLLDNPFFL